MKLFSLYRNGFTKSVRAFSTIVILWGVTLVGTIIVVSPLQRGIVGTLGNSMITEMMFAESGFDLITDIIDPIKSAVLSFSSSLFVVGLLVFLAGIFVTAGIFRVLFSHRRPFRKALFFKGADRGFVGYLVIALISGVASGLLFLILVLLPFIIAFTTGAGEPGLVTTAAIGLTLFAILMPLILLIADFARVNLVADKWEGPLGAIKNGLKLTFKNLIPLWFTMFIVIVLSGLLSFFVSRVVTISTSGSSILVLLLLSQILLFIKIWIKVLRYGIMTAAYESEMK